MLLAASVLYCARTDADQSIKNNDETINLEITTHLGDLQTYEEGDTIEFLLNLSRDAYVLILYRDAADNLVQLLPNRVVRENYIKAGLYINIPTPSTPFRFTVSEPFGRETVWVFAAQLPFPELQGKYTQNGLKKLSVSQREIKSVLGGYFEKRQQVLTSTSLEINTMPAKHK